MWLQFFAPNFLTFSASILSSSLLQGPLIMEGFKTFYHLCKHWTSVRISK
jgi:hypothetical protein